MRRGGSRKVRRPLEKFVSLHGFRNLGCPENVLLGRPRLLGVLKASAKKVCAHVSAPKWMRQAMKNSSSLSEERPCFW